MDSVKDSSSSHFRPIHFRLLQALITIGLILSVVGGTSSFSSDGSYTPKTISKVAIILSIIAYAAEVLIAAHTLLLSQAAHSEKAILFSVIAALPFIFVRLLYSVLSVIAHVHTFSIINGSVAAFAIMAVAVEIIVISIYLFAGWKSDVVRPAAGRYPTSYSELAPPNYNTGNYNPGNYSTGRGEGMA